MNDRATQSRIRRLEMLTQGMDESLYPIIIYPTAPVFPTNKSIWIDSDDTTISFQYKEGNNAVWLSFGDLSVENITDLADVDSTDIGVGKILQIAADGFTHEYVELLTSLVDLLDVDTTDIGNDKILVYNSTTEKHEYQAKPTGGGGGLTEQALTDAATISWDFSSGNLGTVTIAGDREFENPTHLEVNQFLVIEITQGAGGSHLATFDTYFTFSGGIVPILSSVEGQTDRLWFLIRSATEISFHTAEFNI